MVQSPVNHKPLDLQEHARSALQVCQTDCPQRYIYSAQARTNMTERMHGHAMIQETNLYRNNQQTCTERKLGRAIAHFVVHIFFSQVHCQTFSTLSSIPMTQHFPGCVLNFIIVSKFQRANIHNKDTQWTYKTTILWKDIFSCLPTCQKKQKNGFNF